MLVEAKTAYVVLFAFCSITDQMCGWAGQKTEYATKQECMEEATRLNSSKQEQEQILETTILLPPFATTAVCGTVEDTFRVTTFIRKWNQAIGLIESRRNPPSPPESPGDRDPYKDGG